jgi:hypothetical protein
LPLLSSRADKQQQRQDKRRPEWLQPPLSLLPLLLLLLLQGST